MGVLMRENAGEEVDGQGCGRWCCEEGTAGKGVGGNEVEGRRRGGGERREGVEWGGLS